MSKKKQKQKNKKYIIYILIVLTIIILSLMVYKKINSKPIPIDTKIPGCEYEEIKEFSESVYLKIDCMGKDLSKEYKKGDSFKCTLLGEEFKITIKDIENDKILLKSSSYGLYPKREDGSISLRDKVNLFELPRCTRLDLVFQATDTNSKINIEFK